VCFAIPRSSQGPILNRQAFQGCLILPPRIPPQHHVPQLRRPELRFAIYTVIAIPDSAPFSAYYGLHMSCRQIKLEMDDQCAKVLGAHLHRLKATLQAAPFFAQLTIPNTFPAMQHVQLSFAIDVLKMSRGLKALTDLYLESITVVAPRDSSGTSIAMDTTMCFFWTVSALGGVQGCVHLHTRRWIVETAVTNKHSAKFWMSIVQGGHGKPDYRSKWVLNPKKRPIAVWESCDRTSVGDDHMEEEILRALQGL
jgi:hypothetical protein